jgi:hypothetical protein
MSSAGGRDRVTRDQYGGWDPGITVTPAIKNR